MFLKKKERQRDNSNYLYCAVKQDINVFDTMLDILPVLSTSGRKRRKTGRAYGGRTFSMSFTSFSRSADWDGSAMAAIPAFPSAPVHRNGHSQFWKSKRRQVQQRADQNQCRFHTLSNVSFSILLEISASNLLDYFSTHFPFIDKHNIL